MPSSIGPARAKLHGLLVADAPLSTPTKIGQPPSPIQVNFGPPDIYEEQEVVVLGGIGVHDADEESAALGNQARDETYVLIVGIKVHHPSATPMVVDARVYELAEWVRSVVAASPTLDGTVLTAEVTAIQPDRQRTPEGLAPAQGGGYVAFLQVFVSCYARIR